MTNSSRLDLTRSFLATAVAAVILGVAPVPAAHAAKKLDSTTDTAVETTLKDTKISGGGRKIG